MFNDKKEERNNLPPITTKIIKLKTPLCIYTGLRPSLATLVFVVKCKAFQRLGAMSRARLPPEGGSLISLSLEYIV